MIEKNAFSHRNYMETDDEQSVPEFINDDLGDGFDDDNDSDNSGSFWRGATNINRLRFLNSNLESHGIVEKIMFLLSKVVGFIKKMYISTLQSVKFCTKVENHSVC